MKTIIEISSTTENSKTKLKLCNIIENDSEILISIISDTGIQDIFVLKSELDKALYKLNN